MLFPSLLPSLTPEPSCMPVHDWSRVDAGIFHGFHTLWVTALNNALNDGLLPRDYYAYPEQHAGQFVADLLTLHAAPRQVDPPPLSSSGGLALAEAPPRVRLREELSPSARSRRRTLAIRHVSGHRLVAVIEIVSPANKDRAEHVEDLLGKIAAMLAARIHVLLVDPHLPGKFDPQGLHAAVRDTYGDMPAAYEVPAAEPLTLASYRADAPPEAYIEHLAIGQPLPDMPLFFQPQRYINVPLEDTYQTAFRGVPSIWREQLS